MVREPDVGCLMRERVGNVSQECLSGTTPLNHVKGLSNSEMCGVRFIPDRPKNEDIEVLKQRPAGFWNLAHVRTKGHVLNTKPQDGKAAMQQTDRLNRESREFKRGLVDSLKSQPWARMKRVSVFGERISERPAERFFNRFFAVKRYGLFLSKTKAAEIIEAHYVISVGMRVNDAGNVMDSSPHHLLPQFWTGINQKA